MRSRPLSTIWKTLPPSYKIVVGGTVEESAKSQASVIAVVPLMLFIMVTVLMFQLQSFQSFSWYLAWHRWV